MGEYYIYINTDGEIGCPKFDNLDDAIKKYNEEEMKTFKDSIFLGYMDGPRICFDILHKFFNDNILINDYMNHKSEEVDEVVAKIVDRLFIRYQWTADILDGALIDFQSPFADCEKEIDGEKWNEAHISTLDETNEMKGIGWIEPIRENIDKYGWNYPKTASYVSMLNVPMLDSRGYPHNVDVDPRVYLKKLGKKVSEREKIQNRKWKFKPCPFCGSTDIVPKSEVIEYKMGHDSPCSAVRKIWAECQYCGAKGPRRTGDVVYGNEILATAIVSWNERKGDTNE